MIDSLPGIRHRILMFQGFQMIRFALIFLTVLAVACPPAQAQRPAPGCKAPTAVCQASARVFAISSYDPVGSAVLIEPGLLITNRHVVADNSRAQVFMSDGSQRIADVVPTSYPGDLIRFALI
ncbi:MAG TPA: hypothetical protein DC046_01845, partial [Rhodospirillaceae bacterium]|nr:hypothetical protein [Rhodospirillaceae bacterium]